MNIQIDGETKSNSFSLQNVYQTRNGRELPQPNKGQLGKNIQLTSYLLVKDNGFLLDQKNFFYS